MLYSRDYLQLNGFNSIEFPIVWFPEISPTMLARSALTFAAGIHSLCIRYNSYKMRHRTSPPLTTATDLTLSWSTMSRMAGAKPRSTAVPPALWQLLAGCADELWEPPLPRGCRSRTRTHTTPTAAQQAQQTEQPRPPAIGTTPLLTTSNNEAV